MNFLAPQFLFGLFAISIPIIIHLFDFRRAKKVYFSSNRHLRKISEETSSKRNLKHFLILLSRILFISFLVLAFAQPFLPAEEKELQSQVQIYLDNSYSMSNEADEDLTGLDRGIAIVNEIIDQYPSSTRFRLLTNDFEPFSNIFRSKEEVREILTELGYSKISRESNQISSRLTLDGQEGRLVDTYWISDFQSSVYTTDIRDSLQDVRIVPVTFTGERNVFVDSVYTSTPFLSQNERLKLFARLVNLNDREVDNLNLKVFINENQVTTNSITIPPNGYRIAEFDVAFELDDFNTSRISFEDFPVTFDNEFYFILNKNRKVNVIEIAGQSADNSISQVYANTDLFNFKRYPVSNVNYSEINKADLVLLNQLDQLDNSLSLLLGTYLQNLGTLAIVPSESIDPSSFASLINVQVQSVDSSAMVEMSPPDFSNPFFSGVFEEENTAMKMPSGRSSIFWFNDRNAILRFPGGQPFISQLERGGSVFLFSSPFNSNYTSFHLHALFVPVMYKIAMSGGGDSENLYSTLADEQLILSLDTLPGGNLLKLKQQDIEIIPQQRVSGSNVVMELPATEINTGFYEVVDENNTVGFVAFNHDQKESDLTQLGQDQIGNRFAASTYQIFTDVEGSTVGEVLYARYQPLSLWKYCIILALLFIGIEILLIKFMPG